MRKFFVFMNKTKREDSDRTKFRKIQFLSKINKKIRNNKDRKNDIKIILLENFIFQSTFN